MGGPGGRTRITLSYSIPRTGEIVNPLTKWQIKQACPKRFFGAGRLEGRLPGKGGICQGAGLCCFTAGPCPTGHSAGSFGGSRTSAFLPKRKFRPHNGLCGRMGVQGGEPPWIGLNAQPGPAEAGPFRPGFRPAARPRRRQARPGRGSPRARRRLAGRHFCR